MSSNQDANRGSKNPNSEDPDWEFPLWKYVDRIEKITGGGGNWKFHCTFCKEVYKGSYTRVKAHLLQIGNQGIRKCNGIDFESIQTLKKLQNDAENKKRLLSASAGGYASIPLPIIDEGSKKRKGNKTLGDFYNVEARNELDHLVARYFYAAGIALSGVMNPVFQQMVKHACNSNLPGYEVPSYDKVRTILMAQEKANINQILSSIKAGWPRTGVSIVSDGWTDNNSRPLINFLASSSSGPMFLKAIDSSGEYKDATYISKLFLEVITEVGPLNVVQIITDNAAVCKAAGLRVEETYPHIFWTPCVVHTLNLALKDICAPERADPSRFQQFEWIQNIIFDARTLKTFVTNHSHALKIFNKYSHLRLLNVAETRFASNIIMIQRVQKVKKSLEKMVLDEDWKTFYRPDDRKKADYIKNIILYDSWWDQVEYFLLFTAPIVNMLREADSDKPCLHLIYDKWDTMIEKVRALVFAHEKKNLLTDSSDFYTELHDVLVKRWNKSNTPLHCLAYSLVPKFYSDKWLIEGGEGLKRVAPHRDEEISEGRNKCLERLFSEGEIAEVRQQYGDFSIACNKFSSWQSNRDRYSMEPQTWWANYGAGAPKIAALADRLLNQPASSSSCERNWSTFSYILNVKRNRTKANRAEDLVFIHSNLRLLSRREQSYRDGPSKCWDMVAEESNLEFPIDIDLEELSLNDPVVERMLLIADDENQEVDPDMPPLEDA